MECNTCVVPDNVCSYLPAPLRLIDTLMVQGQIITCQGHYCRQGITDWQGLGQQFSQTLVWNVCTLFSTNKQSVNDAEEEFGWTAMFRQSNSWISL